jgi:hypothetical protein
VRMVATVGGPQNDNEPSSIRRNRTFIFGAPLFRLVGPSKGLLGGTG